MPSSIDSVALTALLVKKQENPYLGKGSFVCKHIYGDMYVMHDTLIIREIDFFKKGMSAMDTIEAIKTRRSVRKVSDREPSKELIEQILDAARRAPNHMNTEPWHFIVLTGEGRNKLGEVYGKVNQKNLENADQAALEAAYEKGLSSAKRAPVIIVVTMEPSDNPRAFEIEDIEATAIATQNLMLAAHALGLGSILRTGGAAYTKEAKEQFGVSEKGHIIGFVYLGYPAEGVVPKVPERQSVAEITEWVDA